ncbi:hypothetical protein M3181_24380 [Mesobacillus maritimus]|uniref:hypothetical protein n=1 Tax=Mesobacillus maritimus TaxID=1643336 RepID=UPI0020400F58|nr:hypothetical protein [Mesobacillus maritimus]MCM3672049.1 hypothetical protein [Mesobacillus maritimus]
MKASKLQRGSQLQQIIEQHSWIIEGVYFGWLAPSFSRADKIFILKTPLSIQEDRIWSRYEKRKSGVIQSTKKETLQSVKELIKWNRNYNETSLPNFINDSVYNDKFIHIYDNEEIFNYIS